MQQYQIDSLLARHCAPTLLGVKAASLIALPDWQVQDPVGLEQTLNQQLRGQGVVFHLVCRCTQNALLLAYRPSMLVQRLQTPQARTILLQCGYDPDAGLDALLEHLSRRLQAGQGFPHEIGLFLDYPPADVQGFIRNQGRNCKLCGYWKVYSDVDTARSRFTFFDLCRRSLCSLVEQGNTISQLLTAA